MSHVSRTPVRMQMETYQESWESEHGAVKDCWVLEDTIRIGLATLDVIEGAERSWRDRVFRGIEVDASPDAAGEFFLNIYTRWLVVTGNIMAKITTVEPSYAVDGADRLRAAETKARKVVAGWQLPRQTRTIGMRAIELPPEAADNLSRILQDAKEHPNPVPAGTVPQTMSMAEFLAAKDRS